MKKGGKKFCPPNFLPPFLDSKFNVDYDFAIKHDLNSWSDCDTDVQNWGPKRENRQYYTLMDILAIKANVLDSK